VKVAARQTCARLRVPGDDLLVAFGVAGTVALGPPWEVNGTEVAFDGITVPVAGKG
jgi:hypothetical protein